MNISTITVRADGSSQTVPVTTTTTMPFGNSFWGTPLPSNATVDAVNGPAAVAEVKRQSGLAKPILNVYSWTTEHIVVPATQPLVPVTCASGDSNLNAMFKQGVPIPAGFTPTNDSDAAATFWQPSTGKYWECQALHYNASTGVWSCNFGGRATNVNARTQGHYVQYVTGPSGTYELPTWGTQGSALPYWPGVLSLTDCQRGSVDHALLLEVFDARAGGHVWPASRGDGGAGSTNPAYALLEGYRLRFPSGYAIPAGLHPLCALAVQAVRDYGLVITDRTLSGLAMRAAPSCANYLNGTLDYNVLNGFPWQDLQLLVVGSDSNQTPTS